MNCLLGFPEPHIVTGVPSSVRRIYIFYISWIYLPDYSRFSELFTFCSVCFVYECRQDVAVFYVEVVVGSEYISGDDCCVLTAMLLEVRPVDTNTHVIPMWITPERCIWKSVCTSNTFRC